MQSVHSSEPRMPLRDRLSTKLLLLFAASFITSLVLLGAWAFFSSIGESSTTTAEVNIQTPAIVIDPKLQTDLAKALAFEAVPAVTQVQNPFVDRANLAGAAAATAATATATRASSSTAGTATSNPSRPTGRASDLWGSVGNAQSNGAGLQPGFNVQVDDTKSRHDSWMERQKRGEFVVPESEVLGVEDLVPVGYASGGSRAAEVILLSLSLCRTFSFPAGTRFYDGVLNGFDQREVVFIFQSGVRRKSYATQEPCRPEDPRAGGTNTN
ncbi:MAG TPA: hypothetical protein VFZ23_10095 [Pyrinomonadaceae bacterium]